MLELGGKVTVPKMRLSRSLLRRRVNGGHGFGNSTRGFGKFC